MLKVTTLERRVGCLEQFSIFPLSGKEINVEIRIEKRPYFSRLIRVPKLIKGHYEIFRRHDVGRATAFLVSCRLAGVVLK